MALVPLLVALQGVSPLRGAFLAYASGLVSSIGLLYWTGFVVTEFGGLSPILGILTTLLLGLAFSLFTGAFGLVVAAWASWAGEVGLLLSPVAWVALELLRAHTFFSFPWCLLGYSQFENLPAIQVASYTAVYGVSFLLAGCSAALAYALLVPRHRLRTLACLAALALAWLGGGALALRHAPAPSGSIRVGLVQGNIPQEEKWDSGIESANLERHVGLTNQAVSKGAKLVIWPESAVPFSVDRDPRVAAELRGLAERTGIYLLFGNDDEDSAGIYVGAKVFDPEGKLSLRYHKMHLVPFGEYVPLRRVVEGWGVGKLVQRVGDFTPGDRVSLGNVNQHPVGALICYEVIFPNLVREFAKDGAELLVNITNDAWYGRTSAPYQHFAMAAFRAVENRRFLLRAANTGITAVVDPFGRVKKKTALFEATVVVEDVSFLREKTFYALYGDLFARSSLVLSVLLTAVLRLRAGQIR